MTLEHRIAEIEARFGYLKAEPTRLRYESDLEFVLAALKRSVRYLEAIEGVGNNLAKQGIADLERLAKKESK